MALLGCTDPLKEAAIIELGGEDPAIPAGPLHRAGQPCLLCHDGGVTTPFSVAGTIHRLADAPVAAGGVVVSLVDKRGVTFEAATNCAGNFFVRPGDFTPEYPMWVTIERGEWRQEMESPVNGDGSCATCHTSETGTRSAGQVYILPFELGPEEAGCP
ncbi:uncharacterized protein CMC5_063020 [Chondromyces crocatus]|uniref:Carboxypeptidase regulatory-like domain-containing protein n=2 Tax=Chondromyces crocatus TaxID=52 RepID=A0A0K1EMK4_CHOCO|nr:uncharacterized protein CMC5_063020 [Chondromyces crocatus]